MKKPREKNKRVRRSYPRSLLILLLTAFYLGLFVIPLFLKQFNAVQVSRQELLWQEMFDACVVFVQVFCLFFALTISRVTWIILWPIICVLTAIGHYMMSDFNAQISKDTVAVFLESTSREAGSFMNDGLMLALCRGLLLALLGIYLLLRRERASEHNRRAAAVALMLTAGLITIGEGGMSTRYPPYNFLTSAYQYAYDRYFLTPANRKDISEYGATYTPAGDKPLVIVLVIGESARGDHFSINGYARETTPLLEKRENLVNFKYVTSCGVFTRVSVPCILTRATPQNKTPIATETSIISVFKKLGFDTEWFGAQGKFSMADPTTAISGESFRRTMLEEQKMLDNTVKDEELLPLLDRALETQDKPLFIVLHTYGSHWQYSARYPKAFEHYTPVCEMTLSRHYDVGVQTHEIRECYLNHDALVNSYDNSILYTDYVLDQVITRLEHKNALFAYTSDHGESLGEEGRFLHGHEEAPEDYNVPMFWWASDEFIASHAVRWHALGQKNTLRLNHDVIFHSLLGCAGVSSPLIDPHVSLCSTEEPKP